MRGPLGWWMGVLSDWIDESPVRQWIVYGAIGVLVIGAIAHGVRRDDPRSSGGDAHSTRKTEKTVDRPE